MTADLPPVVVLTIPAQPQLCLDRMLDSIKLAENWKRGTVGRSGEVGPYQILPVVWRKYSRMSQWSAPYAEHRRVAAEHVKWIRGQLRRFDLPESPYFIALAWNAGATAAGQARAPRRSHDYAQRAENLYSR